VPKNIVICCDGTGNEFGDHNSNVVKLYSALIIDGQRQTGYYHPGVGTMGAPMAHNKISKAWSIAIGLGFGGGLLQNVGDAYRYLMDVYERDDKIFLFGFSRGAYTVRALAGLLHMYGLLCPGNDGLIPYIINLYAKKTRKAGGMTHTFEVASGFKDTFGRQCPLHFVGLWDTVSSVGWIWDPVKLPYTAQNPDMANGRHAVSIDERRCYFRSNLWGPEIHTKDVNQNIKQVWFAGVHSDVGGSYSYPVCGLSQITLEWMVCEARQFGLLIDPHKAEQVLARVPPPPASARVAGGTDSSTNPSLIPPPVPPNPGQTINVSLKGAWWLLEILPHSYWDSVAKKKRWRIPLGVRREIPAGSVLHETVQEKLHVDPTYKPPNLPQAPWPQEPRNPCDFSKPPECPKPAAPDIVGFAPAHTS
jgi:uncharacterized protein (DUF2235 family)